MEPQVEEVADIVAKTDMLADNVEDGKLKAVIHKGFHAELEGFDKSKTVKPLENTLQAFNLAWKLGAARCECDIRLTKDGKFVLWHNISFPGNDAKISEMTLEECLDVNLPDTNHPCSLERLLYSLKSINEEVIKARMFLDVKTDDMGGRTYPEVVMILNKELEGYGDYIEVIISSDLELSRELIKYKKTAECQFKNSYVLHLLGDNWVSEMHENKDVLDNLDGMYIQSCIYTNSEADNLLESFNKYGSNHIVAIYMDYNFANHDEGCLFEIVKTKTPNVTYINLDMLGVEICTSCGGCAINEVDV